MIDANRLFLYPEKLSKPYEWLIKVLQKSYKTHVGWIYPEPAAFGKLPSIWALRIWNVIRTEWKLKHMDNRLIINSPARLAFLCFSQPLLKIWLRKKAFLHGYCFEFRNHLTNNNKKWEDPKNMIRKKINRAWTKWEIKCDSGRHTKTLDLAPLKSKTEKKNFLADKFVIWNFK